MIDTGSQVVDGVGRRRSQAVDDDVNVAALAGGLRPRVGLSVVGGLVGFDLVLGLLVLVHRGLPELVERILELLG